MKKTSMNHCFRVIWSTARQTFMVAPETARTAGGRGQSRSAACVCDAGSPWSRPALRSTTLAVLGAFAFAFAAEASASNLPTGGTITAGTGSISQDATVLTIQQDSNSLSASWESFSIGAGHTVNFVQPSSSATAFNTVLGSDVSTIQGALNANGRVFLMNPNGVLFTTTAQVNVGGLVASTLTITEEDSARGRYRLEGDSTNAVINQGRITALDGGLVALVAARVENTGSIVATAGDVLLGAGSRVLLDLGGPVKLEIERGALDALIEQGGAIRADGGNVWLVASAANDLISTVINHTGHTQAQTLATGQDGRIMLLGDFDNDRITVGGTLDASAPNGGNGGFIETSAAIVAFADDLDVSTEATDGHLTGTWLIDPTDIDIIADGSACTPTGPGANCQTSSSASQIGASTLASWLNRNNVVIQTAAGGDQPGNITVSSAISWTSNNDLTLKAHNNIDIRANISSSGNQNSDLTLQSLGSGDITQTAGTVLTVPGKLLVMTDGNIDLSGANLIAGDVTLQGASSNTAAANVTLNNARTLNIAGVTASGSITLTATGPASGSAHDINVKGDILTTLQNDIDSVVLVSEKGNVLFLPSGNTNPSISVGSGSGWKIFSEDLTAIRGGSKVLSYPTLSADTVEQWFGQDSAAFDADSRNSEGAMYRVYYRSSSPEITLSGMDGVTWVYGGTLTQQTLNGMNLTAEADSGSGISTRTLERIAREAKNYLTLGEFSSSNPDDDLDLFDSGLIRSGDTGLWGWSLTQGTSRGGLVLKLDGDYGADCIGSACIVITPRELTLTAIGDDGKPEGLQVYDKFYDGTNVAYVKNNGIVGRTGLIGAVDGDDVDVEALIEAIYLTGSWDGNRDGASLETADAAFVGADVSRLNNGDFNPGGATGPDVGDSKLVAIKAGGELTGTHARNYSLSQTTSFAKSNIYGFDAEVTALDVAHVYGDSNPGYGFTVEVGCLSTDCTSKAFGNLYSNGMNRDPGESGESFADKVAKSYFDGTGTLQLMSQEDLDDAVTLQVARSAGGTPGDRPETRTWNVGAYDIVAGYSDSLEQSGITTRFNDATLTITPRPIVVTANNFVKNASDSDPLFTYVVASDRAGITPGLVNGDSLGGTLVRIPGSTAGGYPINQGSVTDANNTNYTIRYVAGTLQIIPDPPDITSPDVQNNTSPTSEPVVTDGLNYVEVTDESGGNTGGGDGESGPEAGNEQTGGLGPSDVLVVGGGVNTEGMENVQ